METRWKKTCYIYSQKKSIFAGIKNIIIAYFNFLVK